MLLALARIPFTFSRVGQGPGFIVLFVLAFAIYAAVVFGLEKWRVHRTLSWPTATGAIDDVETRFKDGGRGVDYWQVHFAYTYLVDGQPHSGKYHVNCVSEALGKEAAASLAVAQVIVHYDSKNPAKSVLWEKEVWQLY